MIDRGDTEQILAQSRRRAGEATEGAPAASSEKVSGGAPGGDVSSGPGVKRDATKRWSRTMINFWLDVGLLVVFVTLLWVSTVVRFVFPPAANALGWTLWFGTYDQWVGVQFAVVALLAFLVLLHVMLHWPWVCGVIASRWRRRKGEGPAKLDDGTRTIYGVGFLIVLLNIMGLGVAIAALTIRGPM